MAHPFFSIIIPVYNAAKTLSITLASLENQTYQDFEIVLVNDGSVDDSADLCDSYYNKHPNKIIVIHQKNLGQIAARQNGIYKASGEYCLFLDADDTFSKDALETLHNELDANSVDMIIFEGLYVNSSGLKRQILPHYNNLSITLSAHQLNNFRRDVITSRRFNNICFKAIKTAILKNIKPYKSVTFVRAEEDLLMQLPIIDKSYQIRYIPKELYLYQYNADSVTQNFNKTRFEGAIFVSKQLRAFAEKWHLDNYERHCNTRYLHEVVGSVKQLNKVMTDWDTLQLNDYLKKISNDNFFKSIYKSKKYDLSIKQRIILSLLYHKLYKLTLFFVSGKKLCK